MIPPGLQLCVFVSCRCTMMTFRMLLQNNDNREDEPRDVNIKKSRLIAHLSSKRRVNEITYLLRRLLVAPGHIFEIFTSIQCWNYLLRILCSIVYLRATSINRTFAEVKSYRLVRLLDRSASHEHRR